MSGWVSFFAFGWGCIVLIFGFALLMLAGVIVVHYLERRRVAAGRCERCGYVLRGIDSPRCPECGCEVPGRGEG